MLKYSIGWRGGLAEKRSNWAKIQLSQDPIEPRSNWAKIRLSQDPIDTRSDWDKIWLRWNVSQATVCWSLLMVRLERGFFSENVIAPVMAEAWPAKESSEASEAWLALSICPSPPFSALLLLTLPEKDLLEVAPSTCLIVPGATMEVWSQLDQLLHTAGHWKVRSMNFSVPLNLNLNNLFQHWWTVCRRESLDSLSRASKQEKEVCQRGAECQAPAQLARQQRGFPEELERIVKSQQEWLPGGEKAGAGQRSRLERAREGTVRQEPRSRKRITTAWVPT